MKIIYIVVQNKTTRYNLFNKIKYKKLLYFFMHYLEFRLFKLHENKHCYYSHKHTLVGNYNRTELNYA